MIYILSDFNQRYDILIIKFPNILISYLQKKKENLLKLNLSNIDKKKFLKDILAKNDNLVEIDKSIKHFVTNALARKKNDLANLCQMHKTLSYRRTLARGYSIVRDKKMNLVTSKTSAIKAQELKIEFNDDMLDVEIKIND